VRKGAAVRSARRAERAALFNVVQRFGQADELEQSPPLPGVAMVGQVEPLMRDPVYTREWRVEL